MNDTRTASILQRVPVILAVTAASYGLSLQPAGERSRTGHGNRGNRKAEPGPHRAHATVRR
jgi:hypothetical protein